MWTNQAADTPPTGGQVQPYRTFSYNLNGEPTAGVLKDASGLTNRTYAWDGMGKLRSLIGTGALPENYAAEYDGGGMRARATRNGVLSTYSFGLLEETVGVSTVYTPGVSQRKAGVDRFFHSDWIGSSRYLTDSTGLATPTAYRFEAYGGLSASLGPDSTTSKFAGGHGYESDGPGGMQLLGHRYYDAALGRFLNPDPIGFAGGLNLYAYCAGNPVGHVDPSGLDFGMMLSFASDEDIAGIQAGNRSIINRAWNWVRGHPNETARGVVGVADPIGVSDWSELFSGRELFTGRNFTGCERGATFIGAIIPFLGANVTRGIARSVARQNYPSRPIRLPRGGGSPPWITPRSLAPAEEAVVNQTLREIDSGVAAPWGPPLKWGSTYNNRGADLPIEPGLTYKEYYVRPLPGDRLPWGPRRIVKGSDGSVYYTPSHYVTGPGGGAPFVRVR